jgi:hypothetical protein
MKLPFAMTLAGALALATIAQDAPPKTDPTPSSPPRTLNAAPTGQPRQQIEITAPTPPKESAVNTNLLPKMPARPAISHGGLTTDIRKSTNRWKMFSLRRPANLKEDESNLIRNVRTEASPAVKLFSVDF